MLNMKKTKIMIFNFTNYKQLTTRLQENNMNIEVVTNFEILGTSITNDLKWDVNVKYLVKRAYGRLQLLNKAASYKRNKGDSKSIYKTHIRSILEQSSCVWNSSLSAENITHMRRVQKAAVRIIMGRDYIDYTHALSVLKLPELSEIRNILDKNMVLKTCRNKKR